MTAAIAQYVLKVHSRCDLACDHCYIYEHADQSWRIKPRAITAATVKHAAGRIAEHALAHDLGEVHVVLHGGEPLLLGYEGLSGVLAELHAVISPVTRLSLHIQTNGVLLDEAICDLFGEYDVMAGISLDGDREANDRHRLYADGRSSHPQVLRALAMLRRPAYRHLYAGLLCTIDLRNDPIAVYEALVAEHPPRVDLLLPHATWEQPPYRPAGQTTPYAEWLGRIHERWTADLRPVPIRLFDSLVSAARGGPSWSEAVGTDAADLLVIETDGSWEQVDSLKTAYDGAAASGMNVFSHAVDEVATHPGIASRQEGVAALCRTCQECPVVRICGGGLYAHRYRTGNEFGNPSVYCNDLKALIAQVTGEPKMQNAPHGDPDVTARPDAQGTVHALPGGAFTSLAAGPGDAATVRALADVRLSITRALVAEVARRTDGDGELSEVAAEGWAQLSRLDAEHPEAVREVMAHPYTQAWAVRCLRPPAGADPELDRAHVAGLAAAAACHAGVQAELTLPIRDGIVSLPGLGAIPADASRSSVVVVIGGPPPGPQPHRGTPARLGAQGLGARPGALEWEPVRRAEAAGLSVAVDDLDPFRDCQTWPATGRLSPGEWRDWRHAMEEAARRLARDLPAYADAIAAGLRTVVPLRQDPAGRSRSGTARQAFGAVAVALPADPSTLDSLLLHEFQHVKLNALLDLHDLADVSDGTTLRVPWRPDPRPIEGVLHGVYAHLALAELWHSRIHGPEPAADQARSHFLRYRSWVSETIDGLLASRALTEDGERFVHEMRTTVETLEK